MPKKKAKKKKAKKKNVKKRVVKKRVVKKEVKKKEVKKKEVVIGEVTHFFPHVNAAVIKLKAALSEGDQVHIKGHTSDFTEQASSIQIDNKPIKKGKKGDEIGLLVNKKVRRGDVVYKI